MKQKKINTNLNSSNKTKEDSEMRTLNETGNSNTKATEELKAPRTIVFAEKVGEDLFAYHAINTKGQSMCPANTVDAKSLPCLKLVFPTAVCNFEEVDGEVVFGWSEAGLDVFEELVKNLHMEACKPVELKEYTYDPDDSRLSSYDDEDEEEYWDADIPEEERITNPSSAEIERRLNELKNKKQQ